MSDLSPWLVLFIGFLLGWIVQWLFEIIYFRRKRTEALRQLSQMHATLKVRDAELGVERARNASLQEEVETLRVNAAVVAPPITEETAGGIEVQEMEVPVTEGEAALVEADAEVDMPGAGPVVFAGLAPATIESAGLGLAGVAIAGAGLAVAAASTANPPATTLVSDCPQNLTTIAGIDAAYESRLYAAGIGSYWQVANTSEQDLGRVLDIQDMQNLDLAAVRAAAGKLAEETGTVGRSWDGSPPNDLETITGVSDLYKGKLYQAGICTFDALANATIAQLDAICQEPDWRRPDYAGWILQAQEHLVAVGAWTYDDLNQIEGIDPTYCAMLNEQGYTNFQRLATSDEASLAQAIAAPPWRGVRYGDWIAQARLAAAGDEAGLNELSQQLNQPGADNLVLIEGIDTAKASVLRENGIDSFAALGAATPDRLAQISQAAGKRWGYISQPGNYESWIAEARLRSAGQRVRRAKREAMPAGAVAWAACPQDLSQVKGITPLYEYRLYAASIGSYWELAKLSDEALARILAPQPWQDVDFTSIKAAAAQLSEDTNAVGRVWDGSLPDDFSLLKDMSSVYEARLHEAGICTFVALANTTLEQLAAICRAPSWKTPDYGRWLEQAQAQLGKATP